MLQIFDTGRRTQGGNKIVAACDNFTPQVLLTQVTEDNGATYTPSLSFSSINLKYKLYQQYPNGFLEDLKMDENKVYTDSKKRVDINLQTGQPIPAEMVEVDGEMVMEENISGFKVIGAIAFWMKTIGVAFIVPDLNDTMNAIFPQTSE